MGSHLLALHSQLWEAILLTSLHIWSIHLGGVTLDYTSAELYTVILTVSNTYISDSSTSSNSVRLTTGRIKVLIVHPTSYVNIFSGIHHCKKIVVTVTTFGLFVQ